MASSGGTPLFSAPLRQKRANKPVLESVRTFAEYVERRHELLAIIHDGLEDHVRKMEERASEAVAHSVAVSEACRAQEAECLEYIEELENRVRDLHRTKRECAEELKALQQSSETRRQELEKELHDLRQGIDEMRRQKLLAQEQQLHYEMLRDAAKHRYDMAEACLTDFTAKVEFRFQEAVTSLQAAVQERKRWADEECALNDKRVREAELLAEQSDFSAFLRRATEEAERTGAVNLEEGCAAAVEPQLMRNMERDIEELAASVAARLQVIVEQQSAAKAGLAEPPPHVTEEGPDSIHTLCRTAPQPPSEGYQESWRRDERGTGEAVPACHAVSTLGTVEVRVKHALRDLCEGAPLASSIQCAHDNVCLHESATRAAAPLHLSSANAAVASSAPSPSPHKELSPTSVRTSSLLGSSSRPRASATGPEHRLIDNYSWGADKFANIFTPRK
ncbi:hypothetical protein, unknown function [Leishmania tarentolae]|uniref:Uncharacterized protein n=1 Tax=Leishmania tarentolae TaxID=5689 RepID=A0A640KUT9_LEITA|nr:hypothetical protein, unknown function [Leishmania tarentolae]